MIRDGHSLKKGEIVWAWVNEEPKKIKYHGLMPYNGFRWSEIQSEDIQEEPSGENVFADSREELIRDRIKKLEEKKQEIEMEIRKLIKCGQLFTRVYF